MNSHFKVSVAQISSAKGDVSANIKTHLDVVKKAADSGISYVVFPTKFAADVKNCTVEIDVLARCRNEKSTLSDTGMNSKEEASEHVGTA